jgi:hypothetical protein
MNAVDLFSDDETFSEPVNDAPVKRTRIKRTEKDMIASVKGKPLDEAHYLKSRLMKLEDKLSDLLGSASPEALELILKGSPHYTRYLP